jgi:hypothetical protein
MGKHNHLYRQVGLRSGNVSLVANVEDRKDLRVGKVITLKDDPDGNPNREWGIEWVSPQIRERYELERSWDNNI